MSEHIQIKKVKIHSNQRGELKYKRVEGDGATSNVDKETPDKKVHKDFSDTLLALRVHFGILCGYITAKEVKDPKSYMHEIDSFHVSGFSVAGEEEDEGIVITGHRILKPSGKAIILNSPFTRFNEDDATRYKHMDALIEAVKEAKDEAVKYLGGKYEMEVQLALQLGNPEKEEAEQ